MKNTILSILVATTGVFVASCSAPSYTSQNGKGYVNSIYYTAKAPSSSAQKQGSAGSIKANSEAASLRTKTTNALSIGNGGEVETVYVGEDNVVNIDYDPNKTYAIYDDNESYEARLRKFDNPTYTINIEIDNGYNYYWPYYNPWWYGPRYSSYWGWSPWYWDWGWSWNRGFYFDWDWPHYAYHYHPYYYDYYYDHFYDHFYPAHHGGGVWRDNRRYYGRRDVAGVRGRYTGSSRNFAGNRNTPTMSPLRPSGNAGAASRRGIGVAGGSNRAVYSNSAANKSGYNTNRGVGSTTYSTTSSMRNNSSSGTKTSPSSQKTSTSKSNYRPSSSSGSTTRRSSSQSNNRNNGNSYNSSRSNNSYNNSNNSSSSRSYSSGSSYSGSSSSHSSGGSRSGGSSTRR